MYFTLLNKFEILKIFNSYFILFAIAKLAQNMKKAISLYNITLFEVFSPIHIFSLYVVVKKCGYQTDIKI